ncbi:Hypothetical protein SRAE_2000360450 [Strongyloides ratti]|uniref:Uncharacterized protein n=1 Tax=Strongyloides ratti TaxID=34506 RepID=A0A090LGM6_STRRB|nr:Hypothetical protein SRAE_2000360450 [Strongyloides ratti]CEF68951.1 Hypothetical protein SRAE_2000360450 [Strongyloides ratti]
MQKYFEKIYFTVLCDNIHMESPILFNKEKINGKGLAEKNFFIKTNKDNELNVILKNNEKRINCLLIILNNGRKLLDQIKNERKTILKMNKIPDNYLWFKSNVIHEEITFDKKNII